eukprot:532034-Pyramimonas_sp.AAC.1
MPPPLTPLVRSAGIYPLPSCHWTVPQGGSGAGGDEPDQRHHHLGHGSGPRGGGRGGQHRTRLVCGHGLHEPHEPAHREEGHPQHGKPGNVDHYRAVFVVLMLPLKIGLRGGDVAGVFH